MHQVIRNRFRCSGALKGCSITLIMLMALAFSSPALATSWEKVCHKSFFKPGKSFTILVPRWSVRWHLRHGDTRGACVRTAAEVDPPQIFLDPSLAPSSEFIDGIDGGAPRALVRMRSDATGNEFEFVENEVYLITDDEQALRRFQRRWSAEVLSRTVMPGQSGETMYLLNVDPSDANLRRLETDLAAVAPDLYGVHQSSSESGRALLALIARETRQRNLRIGLNVLLESHDFFAKFSVEAGMGDDYRSGSLNFTYDINAFRWPYLSNDPVFDGTSSAPLETGVMEALRSVEAEGQLGNRTIVMIADGGFWPNEDLPPYVNFGPLRTDNPDPGGCGRGERAESGTVCATHGTHVALAGFARPDNGFGTLGPGGLSSALLLLQSPNADLFSALAYINTSLEEALSFQPEIINISAGVEIDSGWCFAVCEPLDTFVASLRDQGTVVVASAGNNRTDVDDTAEVCVGFCEEIERATYIPCELDGVLCVGAHGFFEASRTSFTNYGSVNDDNSVDIFAPGILYSVDALAADEDGDALEDVQIISGTSFAAPFVSGVLALTMAANPELSAVEAEACVLSSAHRDSLSSDDRRRINALGSVSCAMGGTWPDVRIVTPREGTRVTRGTQRLEFLAVSDDYEEGNALPILWTSSIAGDLGVTVSDEILDLGPFGLPLGAQQICAEVTDASDRSWSDCHRFTFSNAKPNAEIIQPVASARFLPGDTIFLAGDATDPDGPTPTTFLWQVDSPPYSDSPLFWREVARTKNAEVKPEALGLEPGSHRFFLTVEDADGLWSSPARRTITIVDPGDDAPPSISIESPEPGTRFVSEDGGPVTIQFVAFATDREDGPLPFGDIEWTVRLNDNPPEALEVTTNVECLVDSPLTPGCDRERITRTITLSPDGSSTITDVIIRGTIRDSGKQLNLPGNGTVAFVIEQILI